MYKLTVVAGPNRGSTFAVQDGETTIGRSDGAGIILPSTKVSKRHCVLVASDGELLVKDNGSSNGTFVNGVLTKQKKLRPGDRVSVGDFVLEVGMPGGRGARPPVPAGMGNVLAMPGVQLPQPGALRPAASAAPQKQNLKDKAVQFFETQLMPVFYGLSIKTEIKWVGATVIGAMVAANLLVSVYPLIESNRSTVIKETGRRAQFIAKQIVERNAPYLASKEESKTEIGIAERAEGVRLALLVDMENRVMAPASRLNSYLVSGMEGKVAILARDAFRKGEREHGIVHEVADGIIVAVEPVKVLSSQAGRNVITAMAVVSIDANIAIPEMGEIGMIYSETIVYTVLISVLAMLILYKMILKPFLVLNDDIDKVLKGEIRQVTHEFKFEELNPLWEILNVALQRVPKATGFSGQAQASAAPDIDSVLGPIRIIGSSTKTGFLVVDSSYRFLYGNAAFVELTGISGDGSIGQDINTLAKDHSLGPFLKDLAAKAAMSADGSSDDLEFSGTPHMVHAAGLSHDLGYWFTFSKKEG